MVATYNKSNKGGPGKADYYGTAHVTASPEMSRTLGIYPGRDLTRDEVANLLAARQADGSMVRGKMRVKNRVAFLDLTFSAPLSFSVAVNLAQTPSERETLDRCFVQANQSMLDAALKLFGHTRTVTGEKGEVAALTFHHHAARPVAGQAADPQRHAHNTVLHHCLTPSGRVLTPNLNVIKGNIKTFGRIGRAHLYANLRAAGVRAEIDPKTGYVTLTDVPKEATELFGNRHKEIQGATPKARMFSALSNRRGKDGETDPAAWREKAHAAGIVMPTLVGDPLPPDMAPVRDAERRLQAPRTRKPRRISQPTCNPTIEIGGRIEVTKRVNAKYSPDRKPAYFASPGHVVTIIGLNADSMTLQRADGKVGTVKWTTLMAKNGEVHIRPVDTKPRRRSRKMSNRDDARLEFETELRARGLILDGPALMDGQWHRVRVDGDKGHERSGKYRGFLDGHPAGFSYNWRNPTQTRPWASGGTYAPPTAEEQARWAAAAQQRASERERVVERAESRARFIWSSAPEVQNHAYLHRKDVAAHNVRQDQHGNLLVPFYDEHGTVRNVQRIPEDREQKKLFVKDAPKTDRFGQIGRSMDGEPIILTEGYATAASIYEATGMTVRFAGDAGNLKNIAEITRKQFPNSTIIIAADNDHTLPRREDLPQVMRYNVGLVKAREAADTVGNAIVVAPFFGALEQGPLVQGKSYPTDWNDLQKLVGRGQMRQEFVGRLLHEGVQVVPSQANAQRVTQAERDAARVRTPAQNTTLNAAQMNAQRQAQQQTQIGHNRGHAR